MSIAKKLRKILAGVLVSAGAMSAILVPVSAVRPVVYKDVPVSEWFYTPVMQASLMELFSGYGGGKFGPNDPVTRAQAVQVLYSRYGRDLGNSSGFADVSGGDWFAKAVTWASESGIVSGMGNGKFAPNEYMAREQLVSILYNKAGRPAVNANEVLASYLDYKDVSSWARDAFAWSVENGLVMGTSETTLSPKNTATRAQMAAIIVNYIEHIDKKPVPAVDRTIRSGQ